MLSSLARAVLVLIATACCVAPPPAATPDTPSTPGTRTPGEQRATTVHVIVWCVDDSEKPKIGLELGYGSGVMIDEVTVLTAVHVVSCGEHGVPAIRIAFDDGVTVNVGIDVETALDVARLHLLQPVRYVRPALIGYPPHAGASVCHSNAYPERNRMCGHVLAYYGFDDKTSGNMLHDARTVPGNSGAGMYDEDGALVGIVTKYAPCNLIDLSNGSCGGRVTTLIGRKF